MAKWQNGKNSKNDKMAKIATNSQCKTNFLYKIPNYQKYYKSTNISPTRWI